MRQPDTSSLECPRLLCMGTGMSSWLPRVLLHAWMLLGPCGCGEESSTAHRNRDNPRAPALLPPTQDVGSPRPDPKAEAAASIDLTTIRRAEVRVVTVHDEGGGPCGILHSVGAVEVEVLDRDAPPAKLGLYVSCPADLRPRDMLVKGAVLQVVLHDRPQRWPKPATRLPEGLPTRYVRSVRPQARPPSSGPAKDPAPAEDAAAPGHPATATVVGRVVNDDVAQAGVPVVMCPSTVAAVRADQTPCSFSSPRFDTQSDASGRFEFTDVPLDAYHFAVRQGAQWTIYQPGALSRPELFDAMTAGSVFDVGTFDPTVGGGWSIPGRADGKSP